MNEFITTNQNVYVQIANYGGYIAEFYVDYDDPRGVHQRIDSGSFSVGFSRRIDIPQGSTNGNLRVEVRIFGGIRVMFDGYIDLTQSNCFNLSGTIFDAVIQQVPCNSVGGGNPTPPSNCNCCCPSSCCSCCPCQCNCSQYTGYRC